MKKSISWLIALIAAAIVLPLNLKAAEFVISNDDDTTTQVFYDPMQRLAARGITQVIPQLGQDAVIVTSLAAPTSPNLLQSRNYAMAGMFHVNVPEDRNTDPAAWYWVPSPNMQPYGWQWFDMVTTPFNSWKGATTITNSASSGEKGHRLVIHVTGGYPVNAYTITVSSSLTNIPTATFNVATNTSNQTEIPFNQNFVGGNKGGNGTNESYWSTVYSQCIQQGDDSVFQSGQLPSTNSYQWFVRFGSTVSINVGSQAELDAIRKEFATTNHWLKVEFKKNGVVVATSIIESAKPKARLVGVDLEKDMVEFKVIGGQENTPYTIESCLDLRTLDWQPYLPDNMFNSGVGFSFLVEKSIEKRFFRAKAVK